MILYTKVGTISGNTGGVMTTVLGAKCDFRHDYTTGVAGIGKAGGCRRFAGRYRITGTRAILTLARFYVTYCF